MSKPFDPSYAPEGFVAVEQEGPECTGCYFFLRGVHNEMTRFCMATQRPDRRHAILKRKEEETSPWASLNAKPDMPLRIEQDTVYTFKKMLRTCDTCGNAICETRGKTIQPCGTWISKTPESATTDTWKDCYYYHVMPLQGWQCPLCNRINAPFVGACPCSTHGTPAPMPQPPYYQPWPPWYPTTTCANDPVERNTTTKGDK